MGAGRRHSAVVGAQGEVYTWGSNMLGQCGCGAERQLTVPQLVAAGWTSPALVACGHFHTLVCVCVCVCAPVPTHPHPSAQRRHIHTLVPTA